jgi:hypothetical protein
VDELDRVIDHRYDLPVTVGVLLVSVITACHRNRQGSSRRDRRTVPGDLAMPRWP